IAAVFLATLVAQYLLRYWQVYLMNWTGQRVMHDLRQGLFAHVQRLPARFFDRTPVGRLMTRILNDVEAINEMFASGIVAILGDVLILAGVVAVMLLLHWRLALVTFAVVPLLFLVAVAFRSRAREAYREVRRRIARLNAYLQENLMGVVVVQLFGREETHGREFRQLNAEHRQAVYRRMRYDALLYASVEVIGSAAVASLLWWGGGEILAGLLTFGVLVAFIEYTHRFFLPIRDVSAKYAVMQSAMVAAERIFALLDTPPEIVSPPAPSRPARTRGGLEFRDVWFAYEGEQWVLRGLSFRVEPGERIALVGATGAGKSTIAKLLNRSYDVARGWILLDGVDLREWDLARLRRAVGLVLQDVFLFAGSVEENIALGDPARNREAVRAAARAANAEPFILALPRGYAEEVRERGANLSHGQRQLLAVARALAYDPAVLVLDEATSSVDPEAEALIRDALDRLLEGRTSLVIAHRLSTIQRADRILVLHRGRLVEAGTHRELLARRGVYATLHELQFGGQALRPTR
ncbi:MAG: ABC transporter ATP-binding protein, partial [Candidatus Rokubacteria bacterium]|nr:ABC transporter ATP-binding protein [Candidatus Rokubacteria bacterium]